MRFTPTDFHDRLDADLSVIEQMLTLPSDPEPTITKSGDDIRFEIVDTVAMPQMQNAVAEYRRRDLVLPDL